jgi:hypothetical protein
MLFLALVAARPVAAAPAAGSSNEFSRVRCLDKRAQGVLDDAARRSVTVRGMLQRIEGSDLVVYLRISMLDNNLAGGTNLMTATAHARYIMVTLDPRCIPTELVPRLGHELQHVVEIASVPSVRDVRGMRALFEKIGWHSGQFDKWETRSAVEVGRRVAREARGEPVTTS